MNLDKITLDRRVKSGENHCRKKTHDLQGRGGMYRKHHSLTRAFDQPRRMLSAGGRVEPKGTYFVRYI